MYPLSTSTLTVPRNPERRLQLPRWSKWYPWTSKSPSYWKWKGFQANENNPHLTIHMSPPSTCSHLSQTSIGYKSILSGMGFPQGLFHVPAPPPTKINFRFFTFFFSPGTFYLPTLKIDSKGFYCWSLAWCLEKRPRLFATAKLWCKRCSRYSSSPPWPDLLGKKSLGKFMVDST